LEGKFPIAGSGGKFPVAGSGGKFPVAGSGGKFPVREISHCWFRREISRFPVGGKFPIAGRSGSAEGKFPISLLEGNYLLGKFPIAVSAGKFPVSLWREISHCPPFSGKITHWFRLRRWSMHNEMCKVLSGTGSGVGQCTMKCADLFPVPALVNAQ
jgi:hypothetical protein